MRLLRWNANLAGMLWVGMLAMGVLPLGCSRYDYVRDADTQAYRLVAEKSNDPRWDQPDFAIELDPRSRYFDPYDTISPPMPPDDPASAQYMNHVDGREHWDHWDQFGHRPDLENPGWEEELPSYVELSEEGKVQLGLEEAVRLATIHQPDFQQELETVYLSALDVSTERFRFDTQFFGSFFGGYETQGPETPNIFNSPTRTQLAPPNSSSQWELDSGLRAERQLATAGELLVGFANSTVWELVGPNSNVTTSVLNFSFVQPLLRAGGRAFALEQLTIVERALLANLRAFERFRHGFFTDIAIGNEGVQGPRRRGGFFGGTGLTGFTGQGSGGFGGVGAATGFGGGFGGGGGGTGGGAGTTGFAGGGAGNVGGFLGLLQRTQQIRNSEQSLELQLNTLELLEESLDAGQIDFAQVAQFRQSIETERATLLQAQIGFQDSLENYLIGTLGLPPDLPVELDQEFIQPFRFTSDEVLQLQSRLTDLLSNFGDEQNPSIESISTYLDRAETLLSQTEELVAIIEADLEKYDEKIGPRLERMTEQERKLQEAAREDMTRDLQNAKQSLDENTDSLKSLQEQVQVARPEDTAVTFVALIRDMENTVSELSQIQSRARLEVITVQDVSLDPEKALEIARVHRLDWMNNRAALVDTWRLIQFNANALKSDVSLRFDGDISTRGGDNPFKFNEETGSLRASLQFDPPFTRLTERNNFRQQLIEYQQSRRQLIQFEDRVYFTLRQLLRNLEQLKVNLEIQRRAVVIAIDRVVQTRLDLNRPIPPALPGETSQIQRSETVAVNLLTALSDLRNTQNNFLSVYLNYYANRMVLMRELGLMRIDDNGMWIDEPLDVALAAIEEYNCEPLPPAVPREWLENEMNDPAASGEGSDVPSAPAPMPIPERTAPEPKTSEPTMPEPTEDEKPRAPDVKMPASRPRESRVSS